MSCEVVTFGELRILRSALGMAKGGRPRKNHFIARIGRRDYFPCSTMRQKE